MSLSTWASVSTIGWHSSWYSDFVRIYLVADEPYVIVKTYDFETWEFVDGPFDVPKKETISAEYTVWEEPIDSFVPYVIACPARHFNLDNDGKHRGWFKNPNL